MKRSKLLILPSVKVWKKDDHYVFDRKYFDGMSRYVEYWPGRVGCVMSLSRDRLPSFGTVAMAAEDLPFELGVLDGREVVQEAHLESAAVVLASGDSFSHFHVSRLCREKSIFCVYTIEYIPETRHQINRLSSNNPLRVLKRAAYLWRGEQKRRAAFRLADGIQASGTAAYHHYKNFANTMIYFDTRVVGAQLISEQQLSKRLSESGPDTLRLAYSGRLARMKGADHLIPLAAELKKRRVPFVLDIFGAGELEAVMSEDIRRNGLTDVVRMRGVVDFDTELLPELKRRIDLVVMLHRQSDPSCTYLETLSCGIPIVGYRNRALSGLLNVVDAGWGADIDDIGGIADVLGRVRGDAGELRRKSLSGLEFARKHSFDVVFRNRIEHLRKVAGV